MTNKTVKFDIVEFTDGGGTKDQAVNVKLLQKSTVDEPSSESGSFIRVTSRNFGPFKLDDNTGSDKDYSEIKD